MNQDWQKKTKFEEGTRAPTPTEADRIKRTLGQKRQFNFLKCPARSEFKKQEFEREGDFSHSAPVHVCDECRCTHTAGYRTTTDLFGIKGVGYYGVGFCGIHEKKKRNKAVALPLAKNQIAALQSHGVAMAETLGIEAAQTVGTAVAQHPILELDRIAQVRHTTDEVFNELNQMLSVLRGAEKTPEAIVSELIDLREAVENSDGVPCTLLEQLDDILLGTTHLTEKCGKGIIRMTDKSKLELVAKLGLTVSRMNLDHYKITEGDYVEKADVAIKITQSMNTMGQVLEEKLGADVAAEIKKEIVDRAFIPVWMNM